MSDGAAAEVAGTSTPAPLRGWLPALILCSGGLAYASSFGGAFLFDDEPWIVLNRDLHRLWPIWGPVSETLRPVVFYSFAVNYAISGLATWSWHLVNLAVHLLAALALFGVVRRTLSFASIPRHLREAADGLALAVAAIWAVHPLTTQAVTYVVQRSESLASLFYLLMLYCFLRGAQTGGASLGSKVSGGARWRGEAARRACWYVASLASFGLGLGSKETIATAPLLLLLYDRAFLTGSLRRSLRERWPVYGVFAVAPPALVLARWLAGLPTLYMFASAYASLIGQRRIPTVAGVKLAPLEPGAVTSLQYLMTQAEAVLHYIRLAVWPHPLVFDYMWPVARAFSQVALPALVVLGLLVATAWAAWRHPRTGFVAAAFFVTLAVSSSVIRLADPVVEHRMYLPLAALVTLAVLAVWTASVRASRRRFAALALCLSIVVLGGATFHRNLDYAGAETMWKDVVEKRPQNPRAHYNLGVLLAEDEQVEGALARFAEAARLDPGYAWAHTNLGVAHFRLGHVQAARESYETALRLDPRLSSAHNNLGMLLASRGDWSAAQRHFEASIANIFDYTDSVFARMPMLSYAHANLAMAFLERGDLVAARRNVKRALENDPELAVAHDVLGRVLAAKGDSSGALVAHRRALELDPSLAVAQRNLAAALTGLGRYDEGLAAYRAAIAIDPAVPAAHNDLGAALARLGRGTEAEASYRAALRLKPDFAEALNNLGLLLASRGDTAAALDSFRRAVAARPGYAEAYDNIGTTLADAGRMEEAVVAYLQALFARPDFARAHNNLAVALWKSGRIDDAVPHFREALRIRPDYGRAQENLAKVLERR